MQGNLSPHESRHTGFPRVGTLPIASLTHALTSATSTNFGIVETSLRANDSVVLVDGVRIDLDSSRSGPVTVLSVLLDTGDPELLARVDVDVVAADAVLLVEGSDAQITVKTDVAV